MQSIRQFQEDHPEKIDEVLGYNPSYVFFRLREGGPYGNINVSLTPGRSVALNSKLFPKGALCFISTEKPVTGSDNEIIEWAEFSRFTMTPFHYNKKRQSPIRTLPSNKNGIIIYFLLNFLLTPANPTKPDPNKSMVVGSGTGAL